MKHGLPTANTNGQPGSQPSRKRTALIFLVNLFLCSWHLFEGMNDNIVSRAAMVATITEDGTLCIDKYQALTRDKAFIAGHYFSDKAPLPAFVVLPFWWAADRMGLVDPGADGTLNLPLLRLGGFLCGSLPFAIIVTLLWRRLHRSAAPRFLSPVLLSMLPLFGSFLFVFSGSWFGHLPGAALLLGAFILLERGDHALFGMLAAAAVLCDYPLVLFPLFWAALMAFRKQWRNLLRISFGAVPAVIAFMAYNAATTGNPLSIGYDHTSGFGFRKETYGFGLIDPAAIWGLTLSDFRGIFFYMPVLLPALGALLIMSGLQRLWKDPLLAPAVLSFLLICAHGMWWGGWTYGPRHLTAVAVLLAYRAFPALLNMRWAPWVFWPTALFGLLCAFAAKSTIWFSCPDREHHPLTAIILPTVGKFHSWMQWPNYLYDVPAPICTRAFLVLFVASVIVLWNAERRTFALRSPKTFATQL
ncbi:MAG: hypothetical protein WAU70_03800 [Flavobacteriales bacterium]